MERLSNLCKAMQLVRGRAGIQTQTGWLQKPTSELLGSLVINGVWSLGIWTYGEQAILVA